MASDESNDSSMQRLRHLLGDAFLCYVLACDVDQLESQNAEWSEAQQALIETMKQLQTGIDAASHIFEQRRVLVGTLLQFAEDAGTSVANSWRRMCGGTIRLTNDETDDCLFWLRRAAEDVYPSFLVPSTADLPAGLGDGYILGALWQHPAHLSFCRAVIKDERLRKLFPNAPEELSSGEVDQALANISGNILLSLGRGGGIQLVMLLETLVMTAYDRVRLYDEHGLEAYLARISEILEEVRRLAAGRRVQIPIAIGFRNVSLSPQHPFIDLPWGRLRKQKGSDYRFVPQLQSASTVLVSQVPVKILSLRPPDSDSGTEEVFARLDRHRQSFENHTKEVMRLANLTRYAILCASNRAPYFAAVISTIAVLDPLQPVPSTSSAVEAFVPAVATTLGADATELVRQWGQRLDNHPRSLDIAMRRTLSAVAERVDPLDGFIDAVLAWENMFSDSPETTLRVCGAIAVLLERYSFEERNQLFKELQQLYGQRSAVVHGKASEPSGREIIRMRDRAIEIALAAMRALYLEDDSELLNKDSAARGKQLLLGVLDG